MEPVGPAEGRAWTPPQDHPPALDVARFARSVDLLWRRTSYSALTASVHQGPGLGVGSEPEQPELADEPDDSGRDDALAALVAAADLDLDAGTRSTGPAVELPVEPDALTDDTAALFATPGDGVGQEVGQAVGQAVGPGSRAIGGAPDLPSPMNGLPAGPVFGTLIHEIFELTDTSAPALDEELARRCGEVVSSRLADLDPEVLAAALAPVFATPLFPAGPTLASIATRDRLAELDFELPLAGGDTPHQQKVTLAQVAALLRKDLPQDDVLAGYPDLLQDVEATPLRGFLTGSIDAVLRLPGPRYVVVDYKTNRLGRGDLTTADYRREAMTAEMLHAHYPLQALLYGVALHRYLRWRQPGYDPQVHLGPVAYLFVRGMAGPGTPPGCGVFDWQPPPALIPELSDLLAGGPS